MQTSGHLRSLTEGHAKKRRGDIDLKFDGLGPDTSEATHELFVRNTSKHKTLGVINQVAGANGKSKAQPRQEPQSPYGSGWYGTPGEGWPTPGYRAALERPGKSIGTGVMNLAHPCGRKQYLNNLIGAPNMASTRTGIRDHDDKWPDPSDVVVACEGNFDALGAPVSSPDPSKPDSGLMLAVPETTHPGESQSNGLAERAGQTCECPTFDILATTQANIAHPPSQHFTKPLRGVCIMRLTSVANIHSALTGTLHGGRLHGNSNA